VGERGVPDFTPELQEAYRVLIENEVAQDLACSIVRQINEKAWAYGRIDRIFDLNTDGEKIAYIPFDKTAKSTLLIAGVDLKPIPEVHLMPNVEVVIYDENETTKVKPDADVIPRLTVYYVF
jgi:hypothetical protein